MGGTICYLACKETPCRGHLENTRSRKRGNYVESHHMAWYKKGLGNQLVTSAFFVGITDGCCIYLTEVILPSVDWLRIYNIQGVTLNCAKL